ncbi:MAG: sugar ABC transporter substrate-binding protein [Negativicutes bacterium]|jgi:ribose transport system substrate-binding protein
MRKLIVFVILVLFGIGLYHIIAWSGGFGAAKKIHVILQDKTDNPFWTDVISGAKAGAKELYDVGIDGPEEEIDYLTQVRLINKAIAERAYAIVIAPINRQMVVDALVKARNANIKIIFIDSTVVFDGAITSIESNNYMIGELAANHIFDDGCKTAVIIRGANGDSSHDARVEGCKNVFVTHNIQIKELLVADSDRIKAKEQLKNVLRLRNNNVDCVFATNDEMALGAADAVIELGVKNIRIVGVDGSEAALKAIADNKLDATVSQNPYAMGKIGVASAIKAHQGEQCPSKIYTEIVLVAKADRHRSNNDIETVEDYKIAQKQQQQSKILQTIEKYYSKFKKYISESMNAGTITNK